MGHKLDFSNPLDIAMLSGLLLFSTDWMKMDLDFTNKKVLVTGAGKGMVLDFVCLFVSI